MKGVAFYGILMFAVLACSLPAADYRVLITDKEKNTEAGFIGCNMYAEAAFLNPSVHRTAVKYEEFDQYIPSVDSDNRSTYDQEKAKHRLFFKPGIRVWSTSGRRSYLIGDGRWKMEKLSNAVKYIRRWKRDSNKMITEITVRMAENKAELVVEAVFTNQGRGNCQVEFSPQISFLRDRDLFLMIPRAQSAFVDGRRKNFFYGEKVRMDNVKGRNYFWRRAAKDDPTGFIDYMSRERIPFNNPNVNRVDVFGFVQLAGKNNLIWDFSSPAANKENMLYIECGWEDRLGDAITAWSIPVKRGQSQKISYRIITVKGVSRFDAVSDNMLVGYGVEKDLLRIEMVPLLPMGVSSLAGEVINSNTKQVLIKQKNEIAEMQPFNAGKMEWRSTAVFDRSAAYPIKMSLHTPDGKLLLKSDGIIVP